MDKVEYGREIMKRGRIIRPKAVVLNDAAMIPEKNLISPPPNQFTHELQQAQPYYYNQAEAAEKSDGEFAAGARVVLMVYDGGSYCRVVDAQGLYVEIAYEGLRRL
jgi:hypothetical protein